MRSSKWCWLSSRSSSTWPRSQDLRMPDEIAIGYTDLVDRHQIYVMIHRVFLKFTIVNNDCLKVSALQCGGGSLCAPGIVSPTCSSKPRRNSISLRTTCLIDRVLSSQSQSSEMMTDSLQWASNAQYHLRSSNCNEPTAGGSRLKPAFWLRAA